MIDDRQTVHADKDKNTVVLQSPEESYIWHYAPGKMFDEIAEGKPAYTVVTENVRYKSRPAHHLRTVAGDTDVYVDTQTRLPMAVGDYEISYEEPPQGTSDIVIPEGVVVVDKRPGATPGPEPAWMVQEREKQKMIESLCDAKAAWSFDPADDPLRRADGMRDEDCHEVPGPEQSLVLMINRLRILTGQNFGYDPNAGPEQKEKAIAAWEQWAKDSGRLQLTPGTRLLPLPPDAGTESPQTVAP